MATRSRCHVQFETTVADIKLRELHDIKTVIGIEYRHGGEDQTIAIELDDLVIVTLGSMTEASSLGGMDAAPLLLGKDDGGAWALWEKLALGRPEFGNPSAFADHIGETKWLCFTTTLSDRTFLRRLGELTGNVPGEGGLITFPDSNWQSIVVPYQPHFIGQPADVAVFWGYGLSVDKPGNFVPKTMAECTGREIMTEILGNLHFTNDETAIIDHAICIPCMMPFITSQFLAREPGDRPGVIPARTKNIAFVGQFCELPDDVMFTVEYSIRSAQVAAYALIDLKRKPPAVYKGKFDPRVLYKAFRALHDIHS